VPDELINRVLEAGRWAPSGSNIQPLSFIVIKDRAIIGKIGRVGMRSVVKRFSKEKEKYAKIYAATQPASEKERKDAATVDKYVKLIATGGMQSFIQAIPVLIAVCADQRRSPVWQLDAGAAIQNMLLTGHSLGLGTIWISGPLAVSECEEEITRLLNVPDNMKIVSFAGLGYPDEAPDPRRRLSLEERVYYERFGAYE